MANISSLDASKYYKFDNKPKFDLEVKEYAKAVLQMVFDSDYSESTDLYILQDNTYRVKSNDGVSIKDLFNFDGFDKLDNVAIIKWDKAVKKEINKLSGDTLLVHHEDGYTEVLTFPLFKVNEDASTFMDLDLHEGEFELVLTLKEQKSDADLQKEQTEATLDDLQEKVDNLEKINKKVTKAIAELRTKTLSKEDLDKIYSEVDESTPPEIKNYLARALDKSKAHEKDKEVVDGNGDTKEDLAGNGKTLDANKIKSGTLNSNGLNIKTKGKSVKDDDTKNEK